MELKKKGIIVGILLLWLLPLVLAGTEYTPSSETNCGKNGKCTLIQYSGIQFVEEDGGWKHFESARSLMGKGFEISYIENDKDYVIDVLDFNATAITLNLNPDGIVFLNKEIPLRVWTEDKITPVDEKVYTGDFKQDYLKTEENLVDFNILKQSETLTLNTKLGDIIEFGFNSTTIILQSINTGNMADADVAQNTPTTNTGTSINLRVGIDTNNDVNRSILIRWNISAIPPGQIIENATLNLNVNAQTLDPGEGYNTTANLVYSNYSWTELGVIYNTRPFPNTNYSNEYKSNIVTIDSSLGAGENVTWNISSIVNQAYNLGYNNFTVYVHAFQPFGGLISGDVINFASRDDSNEGQFPILTITYSQATGSSCTYPGSGAWNINTHDNCTISTNVNLAGNNLILNGSGTIQMNANITNKGQLVMSSGSKFVLDNGVQLG